MNKNMKQNETNPPVVLSVAGSDSSGGAGIQADIKTVSALGCYAASVVTAVTAQNTQGVRDVFGVPPELIRAQLDAVMEDMPVAAVKTGMLFDEAAVRAVVETLRRHRPRFVVCDPVMIATSGSRLIADGAAYVMSRELFPLVTLLTPNLHEASVLLGSPIRTLEQMRRAAHELACRYGVAVLVKGGHLSGDRMCDVLFSDGKTAAFEGERIDSANLHGTGCTLSSAIASFLALGRELPDAVAEAKRYVIRAIAAARAMSLGQGNGPLWHTFGHE